VPEAPLQEIGAGVAATAEGWFVVNVRDAWWFTSERGSGTVFEGPEQAGFPFFPQLGFRIIVLEPGKPNGLYHSENQQEAFLVLFGECTLLVDGEERILRAWDFFHCPAGTEHIFVGAGDDPCALVMAGARDNEQLHYPVSELAAQYGASAKKSTNDPSEAYEGWEQGGLGRPEYWDSFPWAKP
jgi:uncharacterized cupin superfamily protein